MSGGSTRSRPERRPAVSVIVVHWNTPQLLTRCLTSIDAAADGMPFEIVVVDNGSKGVGKPDLRARKGLCVLRNDRNRGFAAAANQAAAAARAELLLFLNTDVELSPGSIAALARELARDGRLAAIAPIGIAADGSPRFPGMHFLNAVNHSVALLGLPERGPLARRWRWRGSEGVVEVDWLRASTLLVRARVFRSVAGFDESYFFYEEDEDLCWRLARRGHSVSVAAGVHVYDPGGGSTAGAGSWPAASLYRGQLRFLARRSGPLNVLVYRFSVSAALLVKAMRARLASRERDGRPPVPTKELLRSLWGRSSKASTAHA